MQGTVLLRSAWICAVLLTAPVLAQAAGKVQADGQADVPALPGAAPVHDVPSAATWFDSASSSGTRRPAFDLERILVTLAAGPVGAIVGGLALALPIAAVETATLHSTVFTGLGAIVGVVFGSSGAVYGMGRALQGHARYGHVLLGLLAGALASGAVALVVVASPLARTTTSTATSAVTGSMIGLMVGLPFVGMSMAFETSDYLDERAARGTTVTPSVAITSRGTVMPAIAARF